MSSEKLKVVQYIVDTRKLWPGATKTAQLEHDASRALRVLPQEERDKVLKYYFVADAKMSLVSQLLKHWAVARYAGVPWAETRMTRDARTKPVYVDGAGRQPVAFNVSHQAGLVALVAAHGYGYGHENGSEHAADVGVDVVCTSERRERDHRMVRAEGWASFVDMHAEVFGAREAAYLKGGDLLAAAPQQQPAARDEQVVDSKLRHFYTLWCLREAYVKMTGEALLAPWLKDLNFMRFRAPAPGKGAAGAEAISRGSGPAAVPLGSEDEAVTTHEILFQGKEVDDANVCIRSLGPDYMVCTAVRTPLRKEDALSLDLRSYEFLSLEDILGVAEAGGSR